MDLDLTEALRSIFPAFMPMSFAALELIGVSSSGGGETKPSSDWRRDDGRELAALPGRFDVEVRIAEGGGPPNMKLEKLVPRVAFGRSAAFGFLS